MTPRPAIAAALLALGALAPARADEPLPEAHPASVSAAAAPDKVRLGEEFVLTVEVRDAREIRYELPPELTLGKDFDVVRATSTRTERDGEATTRFQIRALLFDLGEKALADLPLRALGPDGEKRLLVTGPRVFGASDLKDGEARELGDILPPVPVPVPRYTALYVAAAALAATLLGLALLRWLRHRPRRARAPAPQPRASAYERALQALEALQGEGLPEKGRAKEVFFRVSEILRDYLGERFGIAALDMTTEELLSALRRVSTPGLDYPRFEAFCREGDLVRFARAEATAASCKQAVEQSFGFVRATAPPAPGPARAGPRQGVREGAAA